MQANALMVLGLSLVLTGAACNDDKQQSSADAAVGDARRADAALDDANGGDAASSVTGSGFVAKTAFFVTGTTWHYEQSGVDLGTKWRESGYDDAGWLSGRGAFGAGLPSKETELEPKKLAMTVYFRRSFKIATDPQKIDTLSLWVGYYHGFVAYINGKEVARRGLPAGKVAFSTPATAIDPSTHGMKTVDLSAHKGALVQGDNLFAVELHRPHPIPSGPVFAWTARLEFTTKVGHVTRGPYLQLGTPTGVRVRWRTSVPTSSRVVYGPDPGTLNTSVTRTTLTTEHDVVLGGLKPGTRYHYAVGSKTLLLAGGDAEHSFVAAPAAGKAGKLRIWVLGDSGFKSWHTRAVRDAFHKRSAGARTDLWLMLGDNSSDGSDADYQYGLFEQMFERTLQTTVLWPAAGNHDFAPFTEMTKALTDSAHYKSFTLPTKGEAGGEPSGTEAYYAYDHGNVHFVVLDSNFAPAEQALGDAQIAWLKKDLAKAKSAGAGWLIAYFHHAPYSRGSHDSDGAEYHMKMMRFKYLPILETAGVDLVLGGHSHVYERSYLIDGHYLLATNFDPTKHLKASGDGRPTGGGAYTKPKGLTPNAGAVYVVCGSSGRLAGASSATFDHPVMVPLDGTKRGLAVYGSMILEIDGDRLDASFIDEKDVVRDSFTILKQ